MWPPCAALSGGGQPFGHAAVLLHHGRGFDAVGVIEQHAEVADAPDAGFRADRRLAGLDARVAEGALLRFPGLPVVIDLLVRTARDAHPPAAAFLLIYQYYPVFLSLLVGSRRADVL